MNFLRNDYQHSTRHLTHPKYRPDIDGLRAIAILSVVGFHAFPNWIHGGFIGVDIFFVISGYLISTIIMGSLERNSFSFVEFYIRRINRIFPALLLVLIACFAFGWFTLFADDYKQLGKHIAGGAGFISNYLFWGESGYFDHAAETKPLLHLWSLGIEEQFYIVWPLLLWFVWKKKFNLLSITLLVAFISFGLNVARVNGGHYADAFYSPQTRFWELLVGSVLAYITLHHHNLFASAKHKLDIWFGKVIYAHAPEADGKTFRNVQSLLGVACFAIGFVLITREGRFPGWWAVFPTLGATLIISAGAEAWFNRIVLSSRILVWFGLISFPLYLWHWPLLSFARIVESETPSREIRIGAVLISIVLAWLTYRLIERPFRAGGHSKGKTITLVILMCVVGLVGYNSFRQEGYPTRVYMEKYAAYAKSIRRDDAKIGECIDMPYAYNKSGNWYCQFGDESQQASFFAYGDSHAFSLVPAIEKFATDKQVNVLFAAASSCPPVMGVWSASADENKYNCQLLNERIFEYVKSRHIKSVLLIGNWAGYDRHPIKNLKLNLLGKASFEYALQETLIKYKEIGVRVFLFRDNALQRHEPTDALRKSRLTDVSINKYAVSADENYKYQSWVYRIFENISPNMATIVNFDEHLCDEKTCYLAKEDKFLYFDTSHLSTDGALFVYPSIMKALTSTP